MRERRRRYERRPGGHGHDARAGLYPGAAGRNEQGGPPPALPEHRLSGAEVDPGAALRGAGEVHRPAGAGRLLQLRAGGRHHQRGRPGPGGGRG